MEVELSAEEASRIQTEALEKGKADYRVEPRARGRERRGGFDRERHLAGAHDAGRDAVPRVGRLRR